MRCLFHLSVLLLLIINAHLIKGQSGGPFYFPFGDAQLEHGDDNGSPLITLQQPFGFFSHQYNQIYVNSNGDLTFDNSYYGYNPYRFPGHGGRDIIAPFWTDIDIRQHGVISYQQYTSGDVLTQATQDINQYFPQLSFSATWVFIATWDRVAYFPVTATETSFQVVLISNYHYSFILFNYGDIAPTNRNVQAGYDTADSSYYFSVPGSFEYNYQSFTSSSNINVPGRWAFRVDYGSLINGPFYLFPFGDAQLEREEDNSSPVITLQQPFGFFSHQYNQIYVNSNGDLTFDDSYYGYDPYQFPAHGGSDIIAPFWTDIDVREHGVISYQQYTSGNVLTQATQDINQYFPQLSFSATWVFVATWDRVQYYPATATETSFQVVLISNYHYSFILFNYGDIAPTNMNVQAGYDTADSSYYFSVPGSFEYNYPSFTSSSNINVPGRWAFRVDYGSLINGPFYLFPFGDTQLEHGDDNSSPLITLQQPFGFFSHQYNQIYVNSNGDLTFDNLFYGYNPYRFPGHGGRDIIAPFWTDIDIRQHGVISYQQYTSGDVLTQATQDINQYFPQLSFSATWVFVATWDRVPYFPVTATETSFQVVLISNYHYSFILFNYGDIAPTNRNVQAGYDTADSSYYFSVPGSFEYNYPSFTSSSNINVPGRWAFRVDYGSLINGPFYPFPFGDVMIERGDDNISPPIALDQPFAFFSNLYSQIYVNPNGYLTFDNSYYGYNPYQFPAHGGRDIIAPFWADIDIHQHGVISYQQYTSGDVLTQATQDINQYFPQLSFSATWVFVATWDRVPYYPTTATETSFQVILISNEQYSFILFNYGDIAQTDKGVQAGYDTTDSSYYFSIPGSFQDNYQNFALSSNINLTGRWAFRVDYGSVSNNAMPCPINSHYELCGSDCEYTCTRNINDTCERSCTEGCFCNEGFVRREGNCVPAEQCGCTYNGFNLQIGENFWTKECSQHCECFGPNDLRCVSTFCTPSEECVVKNGRLGCYSQVSTCMVTGDPHYFTFDGAVAHFQGTCSYEISHTCGNVNVNGLQFRVVATNMHRGSTAVSFVSVVDVWLIKQAEQTRITIGQNRKVKVDGNEVDSSNYQISHLGVIYNEQNFIVVNVSNELMIYFDGRFTLLVRLGPSFHGSVCGMCGNNNGDPSDDKILPDGSLAPNDVVFGNSWKSETSSPGCGASTEPDDADCPFREEYSELCSIITNTSGPFQHCNFRINPELYFSSCVYDLCTYPQTWGQDLLCSAVEAYDTACTMLGLQIPDWHSDLSCSTVDPCADLNCTEDEWCGENDGVYGCFCIENLARPNPNYYDSTEICESSSGTMSLSRCQLFEAGFPANSLHLHDPSCKGTVQDGRLVFHFDNDDHICGTNLMGNGTHFIYENIIQGEVDSPAGSIHREKKLNLIFSCIYQLSQTLSMDTELNPIQSIVHKTFPDGVGMYQVRMVPFVDAGFSHPYTGSINIVVGQQIYIGIFVQGVDSRQITTVIDSCWATPVNEKNYTVRWDLITEKCPNPSDGTVEILENGVSTTGRFSFKVFSFNEDESKVYLHCSIHLCLLRDNNCATDCYNGYPHRFRRSADIHDSASISVGPFIWNIKS